MAYVYRHIRLDKNEPFYIGIGSDNKYKRAYTSDSRNKIWKGIVSKTDYEVEIMFDNITWEDACKKEIEFISLYKRKTENGILANLSAGGEGGASGFKRNIESVQKGALKRTGYKRTKEQIDKMIKVLKGIKRSDEFKEKTKNRMIGNSYTKGVKLSEEHKMKISMANKNIEKRKVECPYCNKIGGYPSMVRHHFENCKKNISNVKITPQL